MNNIVFIIVDSLSYDRMYLREKNEILIPFLSENMNKFISATNLYSQGPYTEAGTKGLLCCCDTLDNGGYFLRYDSQEKFITDIFKDAGYETYNINPPTYLLSKRTLDNIDHVLYTSGFDCRFLWSQRFEFYYDKWKSGNFNQDDYDYLGRFVQLVFETAEDFFDERNVAEKYDIIKDIVDEKTIIKNRDILRKEQRKYYDNKNKYIDSIFEMKMEHPIFAVKNIDLPRMIKTEQVSKVLNEHRNFTTIFKRIQFWGNLKNNHCTRGLLRRTAANVFKEGGFNKKSCGEIINRIRNLVSGRELNVYRTGLYYTGDPYKLAPSAKTQFEYAASIIENSDKDNKFVFLHPEEPHYFNTFLSYDVADESTLTEELDYAEEYVRQIGKDYKGSLFYDLSVRYIDKQIENLYKRLEKSGKLDNTLVVITADHGSSYFFDPIRKVLVNNMHSENYHVPLFMFGNGVKGQVFQQMCMSKDIIPTVADLTGIKLMGDFKGHSLLDKSYSDNDSVMIEFMGPGCPDIRLKPVWLSARSLEYAVSYIGYLKNPFNEDDITEIYDLNADPLEKDNIRSSRNEKINILIDKIQHRFEELSATK